MKKQIEMMAHDMCEYFYEGTCYQDKKPCDCKCEIFTDAQYLYAKGYRKASTVVEEVMTQLDDMGYLNIEPYAVNAVEAELKKKYESEGGE